jgi:MFS family permease
MNDLARKFAAWLPQLDHRVWILFVGRLLSQLGTGFTLFYASIFFVNQVGLSATSVGIGIGSGSISGIVGRVVGGSLSDDPRWGRRWTLLMSAAVSAVGSLVLALSFDFPTFVIGNLLMGLGIGLYWPATEAVVADLTTPRQRNEAYALTRLADSLGLGLGVVLGGILVQITGVYRSLFIIDSLSFVVFFGIIYWAIAETLNPAQVQSKLLKGWAIALRDRPLLVYALVNILFTTYLAQVNSTLPLYFSRLASGDQTRFSAQVITVLFSWHVLLAAVCQLPLARVINRLSQVQALLISALLWAIGFILVWLTGVLPIGHLLWAVLSLSVMAIATVVYTPVASSLVVNLAPDALRGVYLSINSLCWAVGYGVGPPLGGWAMDQSPAIANQFWLVSATSVIVVLVILFYLDRMLQKRCRAIR